MYKVICGATCKPSAFLCFLYLTVSLQNIIGVRINRMHVPKVTQLGSPVVLDCDYTLDENRVEGLVIKWYFNGSLLYQWIPNNRPKESDVIRGRINLNYSASKDTHSQHRALHILKPGPDLSGDYTCVVSTFRGEDKQTRRMLVYVPEKNFELKSKFLGNSTMELTCTAEGVYPKPTMKLFRGNRAINASIATIAERADLYDIKAKVRVPAPVEPDEYSCELDIPQANYTTKKNAVYYPEMYSGCAKIWNFSSGILAGLVLLL